MNILLLGLNHNTAPVALRERLALNGCGLELALQEFAATHLCPTPTGIGIGTSSGLRFRELAILSTCNRLELYAVVDAPLPEPGTGDVDLEDDSVMADGENGPDPRAAFTNESLTAEQLADASDGLRDFLAKLQNIATAEIAPHLYHKYDEQAIAHLLRVACGLESMILGEPQILGQVSRMQKEAQGAETTGPILSHLCSQAIRTGRRARTETGISRHSISVSHAAVRLAIQKRNGNAIQNALIVGAGEMAELAATALQLTGVQSITVINRTFSTAQRLADSVNASMCESKALEWAELEQALIEADVVFSATGAPHTVIHPAEVEPTLTQRDGRPLLFMDLAVPRDIDEAVGELPTVECCDVDDLQGAIDENMAQRRAAVPHVESIVAQERGNIIDWLSGRQVVPVITELRRKVTVIAAGEVAETKLRLRNLAQHFDEVDGELTPDIVGDLVERLAHRIVGKLMHEPTIRLKEQAAAGYSQEAADLVSELFDLHPLRAAEPIRTVETLYTQDELHDVEPFFQDLSREVVCHD